MDKDTAHRDRTAISGALNPVFYVISIGFATLATLIFMAAASVIRGDGRISYDTAPVALVIHVSTVVPALFLGAWMAWAQKGTPLHKAMGRVWAALMMTTALASFGLTGLTGGIGPIHVFSVVTLISIPRGIIAARRGNIRAHQRAMIGPYIGLVVAGLFSFLPGRLFGNLVTALL